MSDTQLLSHYLAKGAPDAAAWNLSPECAYIDYRLRRWVRELVGSRTGLSVLNVGIGVGEWDDFLGYLLAGGGRLTSLDVDPDICRTLELRQRREGHPNPAAVVCADLLTWQPEERFDLVTVVGSTLAEIGDAAAAVRAALGLLADGGRLALFTIGDEPDVGASGGNVVRHTVDDVLPTPLQLMLLATS